MFKRTIALIGFMITLLFLSGCGGNTTTGLALPDLTGKTQAEVETILADYPYSLVIKTEENMDYSTGIFIRYGNDLESGDSLTPGSFLQVYFALNRLRLPDLTAKTQAEIIALFADEDVTLAFATEINMAIDTGLFSRYGDDLEMGDPVAFGADITIYLANNDEALPDLDGLTESEIIALLEETSFDYTILEEENDEVESGIFSRYGNDLDGGDLIQRESAITVYITMNYPKLPDLAGMDMSAISLLLRDAPFLYEFLDETNNDVADGTFSRYGDLLEAGDSITDPEQVVVIYIGFNATFMPVLSGKLKGEIHQILTDLNILYEFADIVDDDYAEGSFAGYANLEAGDIYPKTRVTVNVYKNTFTDQSESLFISKVVEGGLAGGNQAIEIFNPLDVPVDLYDYHLAIYTNGSLTENYIIPFADTLLAPLDTYVVVCQGADAELIAKADLVTEDLLFDGNDVIQLRYKNNTYIDTIYPIGTRTFIMDDEVFIRRPEIVVGTRNYSLLEWTAYVPTYYEAVGTHPVDIPVWLDFAVIDRPFRDPLGGTVLVNLVTVNDGDTAGFNDALTGLPTYAGEARVRFLGIDTPETYPTSQPWGQEAKTYTTNILYEANIIYIQSDPALGFTETYGRHLAFVWVDNYPGHDGMVLLNYELVRLGFTYNYLSNDCSLVFNNRYLYRWFQDAENEARANARGIHS